MLPDEPLEWCFSGAVLLAIGFIGYALWREYRTRRLLERNDPTLSPDTPRERKR